MTHFEYAGYTFDRAPEGDVAISGAGVTARNMVVTKDQVRAVGTLDVAFQEWRTSVANLPVTGAFAVRAAARSARAGGVWSVRAGDGAAA